MVKEVYSERPGYQSGDLKINRGLVKNISFTQNADLVTIKIFKNTYDHKTHIFPSGPT